MINCPDCNSDIKTEKNQLSDTEWTVVLSCVNCSFLIETESNIVSAEKTGVGNGIA